VGCRRKRHENCNWIWAHQSLNKMFQIIGFVWKCKAQTGAILLTVCRALYWTKGISSHGTRRHTRPRRCHQLSVYAKIYGKMATNMFLANVLISSIWKLLQLLLSPPFISNKCLQFKYHLLQSGTFPLTPTERL